MIFFIHVQYTCTVLGYVNVMYNKLQGCKWAGLQTKMMIQVAVVGAGIIGLSVGTYLLQTIPRDVLLVTVVADRLPPDTLASDRSGGLILFSPHYVDHGTAERTLRWVSGTRAHLDKIYNSPERDGSGISSLHGFMASEDGPINKITVDGQEMLPGWREASESEKEFIRCSNCEVLTTVTYSISSAYMKWLLGKFTGLGGVVVKQKLDSLSTLDSYDIIINCSGLGARELVNDENVYPLKGHSLSVKAPWIKQFFFETSTRTLILPREDSIILGSMLETYNGDTSIDPDIIRLIREKAERRMPSLQKAEDIEVLVGVRPMRMGGVRLERDPSTPTIIHCYGHATNGYCYHWGCAEEVGQLVKDVIQDFIFNKSKL